MTALIVGNAAHLDLILRTNDRPTDSGFGALLDSPGQGGQWSDGGAAMTIALAFVRMGQLAALWHPLPRGKSAEFGLQRLQDEGVETSACPIYDGEPVRSIIVYGPNWRSGWSAPPTDVCFDADMPALANVSSVIAAPVWGKWTDQALDWARHQNLPITLVGFSDRCALDHKWNRVIVDEAQAAGLIGCQAEEWVITDGANGARVMRRGRLAARIEAVPAAVVDTTGAGDTFAGAYLGAIEAGLDLAAAGRMAAERAARICETWGSRPRQDFFENH